MRERLPWQTWDKLCKHCHEDLTWSKRANYCSYQCRQKAYRKRKKMERLERQASLP